MLERSCMVRDQRACNEVDNSRAACYPSQAEVQGALVFVGAVVSPSLSKVALRKIQPHFYGEEVRLKEAWL
jgi:hypothetical protein